MKAHDPIPALDISFIHSVACAIVSSRGVCFGRPKESEIQTYKEYVRANCLSIGTPNTTTFPFVPN